MEEVQTEVETILQGIQMEPVLVGIVMGSESDREVMDAACKELDERKIKYELNVLSAHRDPDKVAHYARTAQSRFAASWGLAETGATGPTGNRYGDPAGHSCVAIAGVAEQAITLETGNADRLANMHAFAAAALKLLARHLSQ